jgi:hypothetical protein
MERVNITIGPLTFDRANYDAENDVLYLHLGDPQAAEGEERRRGPRAALHARNEPGRRAHGRRGATDAGA